MAIHVADLNLLRDQLLVRRQKLEATVARTQTANLVQLLEEVDKALEKVEVGSYGVCEACLESVETDRLLADPLTRVCLGCLQPAEQRALEQDLELAARIQAGLLPEQGQITDSWKVAYHYEPAGPVSGDYCDLMKHGRYLYFMVGDVSGKGIAASMLMANLHALFRVLVPAGLPPAQLVERANRVFTGSTLPTQYATLICGRADDFGHVEICNGGHVPPFQIGSGGLKVIESASVPVGLFHDQKFSTIELALSPGDGLVLYTDGLSEAEDHNGASFSETAMKELLLECHCLSSPEIVKRCIQKAAAHRAGPKLDDQTLMVLQFSPAGH